MTMERDGLKSHRSSHDTLYDSTSSLVKEPVSEHSSKKEDEATTYTIQEAIDHMGFGWFQIKVSILTGICWMADSMELMLLSIIGPVLYCQWYIEIWEQALLSTLVLLGMAISGSLWGTCCDKYGRKSTMLLACVYVAYYGILTAVSPNYAWVAFARFLVGLCLGITPQAITLYSEFLPTKSRALCVICIEVFFALGSSFEVVLAKLLVPPYGFRALLGASAVPMLVFVLVGYFLPESVRYYLASGDIKSAQAILNQISRDNRKPLPPGKLSPLLNMPTERGRLSDLYKSKNRRLSILVQACWFLTSFCYFGIALLVPTLFTSPDGCHGYDISVEQKESCTSHCVAFTEEDYTALAVTGFADFPGLILVVLLMTFMGRRSCMGWVSAGFAVVMLLCNICMSRVVLTVLLFVARALIAGLFQGLYVYTSEVYPTHIRSVAMGLSSGIGRIGSVLCPFLAQVGTEYSAYLGISGFAVISVILSVCSFLLPIETKGKSMKDEDHE